MEFRAFFQNTPRRVLSFMDDGFVIGFAAHEKLLA
jgi:hypothetical protein